MINTAFNLLDLIMTIGALCSGIYLMVFTISSLRHQGRRFPESDELKRFLVLLPEGSELGELEYPEELYRVEHYDNSVVDAVQAADISQFDMFVILGETTHVSPHLLKDISDAHYGNARAIQLCHIVEGRQTFLDHKRAMREGVHDSVVALGHNRFEWPSALRRLDIAIDAEWLQKNLFSEKSNIENRLLHQGIFIHFLPYAQVFSNAPRRYKSTPLALKRFLTALPVALSEGNLYYADRIIRGVCPSWILQITVIALWTLVSLYFYWGTALKWLIILVVYTILIAIAVPDYLVVKPKEKKGKKK
jgi:hypothetical protein